MTTNYTIRNDQGDFSHIWSGLEPQDFCTFTRCWKHVEGYVEGIAASYDTAAESDAFVAAVKASGEIGNAASEMATWVTEQNVTETLPEGAMIITPRLLSEKDYTSPGGWSSVSVRGLSRGIVEVTNAGNGYRAGRYEKWHETTIYALMPLGSVMTAGEAQERYNLSESAVRLACQRGSIPARKSGGTWLILRADAEARWGLVDCKVYQSQGQWIVKTPAHQLVVKDRAQGFELARAYSDSSKRYYALVAEIINGVPGNEAYRE